MKVRRWVWWGVSGAVFGTAIVGGMMYVNTIMNDSTGAPSAQEIVTAREAMVELDSFEAIDGSAEVILSDLRTALEEELGPLDWKHETAEERDVGGCSVAERTGGAAFSQGARSWLDELDPVEVDRAVHVVVARALAHGYGVHSEETVNRSGGRYVVLRTERNGFVRIVATEGLGIRVLSDCFLTEEGKARVRADQG